MIEVIRHFLPELLAGFLVNLQISAGAVVIGLAIGVPLALARRYMPRSRRFVLPTVRLMQAAPVYVVMFFVLSLLPRDLTLFGVAATGLTAVILSQSVYMTSYIAENFYRAMEHLARDERDLALLFLPNLLRGFVLVVMSSGFGAAIGVQEAVGVTMRQAERLHAVGERVVLFLVVIGLFAAVFGVANGVIRRLMRRLATPKKLALER
jgi:ABC-type amino acid transport system permease subunit